MDAAANRLLRDGEEVRWEPKVMSVLVYLARHRGQVVSRSDLESGVWTGMVVGYDAVTNAIIKLRRALGDDSRAPRIIETISKQGYRLIADVRPVDEPVMERSPAAQTAGPVITKRSASAATHRRRALWPTAGVLTLLLVVLSFTVYVFRAPPDATGPVSESSRRVSIAVLPFDNATGYAARDYFSNGITEDLITDLAKVSGLMVVGRSSAFAFQGCRGSLPVTPGTRWTGSWWARGSVPSFSGSCGRPGTARNKKMVPSTGFEPVTCRLGGGCSILLSYEGWGGPAGAGGRILARSRGVSTDSASWRRRGGRRRRVSAARRRPPLDRRHRAAPGSCARAGRP